MTHKELLASIEEYITYLDVKKITKESYKRILLGYAMYVERLTKPPTREDVKEYRDILFEQDKRARTIQKYIVVIKNFYEWVYAEGRGSNIAIGIKGAKIKNDFRREPLSVTQAHRLLEYAKDQSVKGIVELRNFVMISLMITTGVRAIEVSRSKSNDISYVEDAYALYVKGKGRDDKDDYVKLSPSVYKLIEKYLVARSDENEPLFINHGRTQKDVGITTRTISKVVKEYLRDIGIDDSKYTAHSLRHTAATIAMREGADLHSTQQLLRHKSPNTTQIYLTKVNRRNDFFEKDVSDRVFGNLLEDREEK